MIIDFDKTEWIDDLFSILPQDIIDSISNGINEQLDRN